jgi:hypothetical protein
MPEYTYSNGEHSVDIFYKMSEKRPDAFYLHEGILHQKFDEEKVSVSIEEFRCQDFAEESEYVRIFTTPGIIIDSLAPKTIGDLARQNTKHMINNGQLQPKKEEKPWWRDSAKPINIAGRSKKEISNYIATGKFK